MFIYFPEYVFKKFITITKTTFKREENKDSFKNLILENLKDEDFRKIIQNFEEAKLFLPSLKFSHCKSFTFEEAQFDLGLISKYDKVDNEIEICKNHIQSKNHIINLLKKELSYAYDLNTLTNLNGLNDYATLTINSCRRIYNKMNKIINPEIIKRCAYLDFKYRFKNEIKNKFEEEYSDMDNLKLNEISKKIIDNNF